ncbi:TPA: CoA pyrophosphatase [Streptococcus suis]|nr:CoA pyrophosphatase [Streptococcus suis]NQP65865.1 CoA pyrophosphatase [Streptococcus suis]
MPRQIQEILDNYKPQPLGEKRSFAVFLPLVWSDDQWQVLYEVRSESISQPGEVSFPGGGIEEGESAETAVVREVVEELNLAEESIEILGEIDYLVFGKSTIRCFVGRLNVDWKEIVPNEEVARLFTVPLATLLEQDPIYYPLYLRLDPEQDFPFERIRGGRDYPFKHHKRSIPFYDDLPETVWGITAQFTHCFTEIIRTSQIDLEMGESR